MKKLLLFTFGLQTIVAFAQDSSPMVTDRPTQSAASTVVPLGTAIVEYGFVFEDAGKEKNITLANIHARIGLLKFAELRITQNVLSQKNEQTDETVSGLMPLTLGTKVHLLSERGALPQTSIIGQVTLDNGKDDFRTGEAIPEVRLNFSNTLGDNWSLGYNVGMQFPEDNTTILYTLVLGSMPFS